ncbi:MAG: Stk1 family PASTA domain-containing Ser/Thr kinase [Bacilli bacterium]|nr:Stk1 family PASTA domain-containing Ser/Thr kinase [Bacilli bacterium]
MIQKGQKINDRYEIIRSIGEGGMANVYLAYDTILNRNVAVKILRGDLANDEKFVRRFQREAISASSLNHPNIVEMYDVGEDEGKYFIVMEYLEGETLKTLIKRRGALTLTEVIDIMLQLTSGLACAHESYIIHRDIKPQNVVILEDGTVKITDFGIAMALNSNELTQTNSVMGSVHYLPPEQANGTGATIQSDIYSAGILMYELLTGKIPFKGENAVEIAIKHMKEKIPSVVEFNPEIPQSVENVILKACAKNPKNRYASAMDMYNDLKTCLDKNRLDEVKVTYQFPETEEFEIKETREKKYEDKEQIEKDKKNEKKLNKVLIITGIFTSILALIALIILFVVPKFNNKEVEVPDVANMTVEKAEDTLEEKGFKVNDETKEVVDDNIEEGNVVRTNPASGRTVKKGALITLYVSSGKDKVKIEDYKDKELALVKPLLEQQGLIVEVEEKEFTKDDNIKENIIVEQSIKAKEEIEKGSIIKLTVSKIVVTYPDFVNENYTISAVEDFCTENNITLIKNAKETNEAKENTIIYQSRPAGQKVISGVTLKVTYAIKKEEVTKTTETDKTSSTSTDKKTTDSTSENN